MSQPVSPNLAPIIIPQDAPLLQMPQDIVTQFLKRLGGQEIAATASVCKQWNQILNDDDLWRVLFSHHFPSFNSSSIVNFQHAYKVIYSNLTNGVYASHTLQGHENSIDSLAIFDGRLYSGSSGKTIKVWDIKTGECIATLKGHNGTVCSIAIGDGFLYSASSDKTIKVWDIKTGECKATLKGHDNSIYSLAIGGGFLYSGSSDKTIKVWVTKIDGQPGWFHECIATFKGHENSIDSLAIFDGRLYSGSSDKTIKVWDIKTGECIATLKGHNGTVCSIAIVGGFLYSGSSDKTIRVWGLKTGDCMASLRGHDGSIYSLAIGDGFLYSGSIDKTIKVWDIKTGECIATLKGHDHSVYSLAIGCGILCSSSSSFHPTIKVWDFTADHSTIFQEIATLFESGNEHAFERFSRMPKSKKNAIYQNLYKILKSFNNGYQGSAEDAFYNANGQSATSVQKARAIRDYLNTSHPLLIDLGIGNDKDYSQQLHCHPDDPQKRGIQSQEDLEIICPTFTLKVESIQQEEDVPQDRLEAQKTAGRRRQKLSDVVESMSDALKKMTTEAKTSGVILYESGCPWSDLEGELNAFQNELVEIVKCCEDPTAFIKAFSSDNYNQLANRLNGLAKKFNEGFPGLYREHQVRKLEYYMNQFGILKAWNNRRDQGLPQNLASLPASERTLQRLFSMGE